MLFPTLPSRIMAGDLARSVISALSGFNTAMLLFDVYFDLTGAIPLIECKDGDRGQRFKK